MRRIASIGGGFAGLTAAYELGKKGYQTFLFDHMPELGGLASSIADCPVELTTSCYEQGARFVAEIGL